MNSRNNKATNLRSKFKVLLLMSLCIAGNSEAAPSTSIEAAPLFRARQGKTAVGAIRTVAIPAPKGWKRVSAINQDPLSLAQWTPNDLKCPTGAASRLSLYAVDVGLLGPHKLMQKWLPDALKFHVGEPERGFIVVRAEAEDSRNQAVLAYPLSDERITPLAGWIGGVNVVFIAESTTQTSEQLEHVVRAAIRNQTPVNGAKVKSRDVPFVLFNKEWHKSLSDRLEQAARRGEPNALVSKAYSMFNDADGFVPVGQALLLKAAEKNHPLAQLDLIRLSRRGLLTIEVSEAKIKSWSKSLADAGSDDARFWATENRPFDEVDEQIPGLDNLKKLASCGQPEARRTWAKHLVQSFKASERFTGRNIVMSLMRAPPLEGTLPITTRVPRAVEAPATELLKAAALLKTACPNEEDPEQDLFASGDDFKIAKKRSKKTKVTPADPDDFPELKEAQLLDKKINSGSMAILKEGQKAACNWSGSEDDRNRLVIEIAARHNDGFGKWRRFRACEFIRENVMANHCREKALRQANINIEARYRDILVTANPELRNAIANLRKKATAFHDALLAKSYEAAGNVKQKSELDNARRQMEMESLDLVAATLNRNLRDQIKDVVTGRRLLLQAPTAEETNFTLKRQPASAQFLKKELERLETRMKDTVTSIEEADSEDLSKEFKEGLLSAFAAWKAYRESYATLAAKLAEQGAGSDSVQAAADLWFHIEGIYYFEMIRDREIDRVEVPPENEHLASS